MNVTLVEAAPHILAPFDTDMVVTVEKEISDNGVEIILNDGVKAFKDNETSVEIILNSGKKLSYRYSYISYWSNSRYWICKRSWY